MHYEIRYQQIAVHTVDSVHFTDYNEAHDHYEELIRELGKRLLSVTLNSVEVLNTWTNPAFLPD